jgi:hypothetical protein
MLIRLIGMILALYTLSPAPPLPALLLLAGVPCHVACCDGLLRG